jgi:hypothetical protein
MDFLDHREVGMVFYQAFLLSPLQCSVMKCGQTVRGCVSLKKYKSQGKAVEFNVERRKTLKTFVWICPRIRPLYYSPLLLASQQSKHYCKVITSFIRPALYNILHMIFTRGRQFFYGISLKNSNVD